MSEPRIVRPKQPFDTFPQARGGFYFIANVIENIADLPIQITDSVRLERPDESQTNLIQQLLDSSHGFELFNIRRQYYEYEWIKIAGTYTTSDINRDKWRYVIMSFEGDANNVIDITKCDASC